MGTHDAALTRDWGDGTHTFRLPIDQLLELQEKCSAGPPEIYRRLLEQRWRVEDLREIIRLALIGGGMDSYGALVLTKRYVDPPRPLLESVPIAVEIIQMALLGPPEDAAPGKPMAEVETAGSPLPPSTPPAARSGSRRKKSVA